MLVTQLNSALIWGCLAVNQVGAFNLEINGTQLMNGDYYSLRHIMINLFLTNLLYLEPLNLFFYTWRFLREIELAETNKIVK